MDIKRGKEVGRRRLIRRVVMVVVILAAIPLITWGLSRLKPAAPTVERATIWVDEVKRGPMLRQVRGLGTLIPEEVLLIPAAFDSRVVRIPVQAGITVRPDTVLMVLSNPQMELDASDLEWQVKAAKANYTDLKVRLESQRLDQTAVTAQTQSDYSQAKLTSDRDEALTKLGLKSDLEAKLSIAKAEALAKKYEIDQKKGAISAESVQAQLDAQKVQIEKLQAQYELKRQQVQQLTIRAGTTGQLQQIGTSTQTVDVGQRVAAGAILAKIAQPSKLKAELQIAETQAKDIAIGQIASIDTRNGIIPGRVSRIDPSSVAGTVKVDVKLVGELPPGARPDLSVDGTIELERLSDVLYVGRPVFGQAGSKVTLFRLEPDGKNADRTPVTLGRSSVNTIEILDGLKIGDKVVLSDMSAWDPHNRIRLN